MAGGRCRRKGDVLATALPKGDTMSAHFNPNNYASNAEVLKELRIKSIRMTFPEGWICERDEETGNEVAKLDEAGCQRIIPLWGIDIRPSGSAKRTPEKSASPNDEFTYTVIGSARCDLTGEEIFIEGKSNSTDDDVKRVNA